MKKLVALLSLSFLLTACFEQTKVEKTATENGKAEGTEAMLSSASTVQDNVAENKNVQITKQENEVNPTPSAEEIMSKETLDASPVATDKEAIKTEESTSVHNVNSSNKAKTKARNGKPVRNASARAEDHFNYNSSGLSPEELRLFSKSSGVADFNALTDIDIIEMKNKCRYPFMTESEIKSYRCDVKPVTIK